MRRFILGLLSACLPLLLRAGTFSDLDPIGKIQISVKSSDLKPNDTLYFRLYSIFYPVEHDSISAKASIALMRTDGSFRFVIPVASEIGYFEVFKKTPIDIASGKTLLKLITPALVWEKGDSVLINMAKTGGFGRDMYNGYRMLFSGRNAGLYTASLWTMNANDYYSAFFSRIPGTNYPSFMSEKGCENAMKILDSLMSQLSQRAYNLLKADIRFSSAYATFRSIKKYFKDSLARKGQVYFNDFASALMNYGDSLLKAGQFTSETLCTSKVAADFYVKLLATVNTIQNGDTAIGQNAANDIRSSEEVYDQIRERFNGIWRDKLSYILLNWFKNSDVSISIAAKAANVSESTKIAKTFERFQETRGHGEKLMDFSLPGSNGRLHSTKDYRGKILFIDLWYTGCGGCTHFYRNVLADIERDFARSKSIQFISVSVDISLKRWKDGLKSDLYTGPGALNLYTNGMGAEHPFIKKYNIQSYPTAIIADREGRILKFNTADIFQKEKLKQYLNDILKGVKPIL